MRKLQVAYDVQCKFQDNPCRSDDLYYDFSYIEGPFTDREAAKDLKNRLKLDCDEDCMRRGHHFSLIYSLNTIVFFFYAL